MKRLFLITILLSVLASPVRSQWIEDAAIDATIRKGILDTYNLKFESADRAFRSVVKSYPKHPAGYFFLAMVEWWRILIDLDNESRDEGFYDQLDRVIEMCDEILDEDDRDLAGLFFKGGAIGYQGRLMANRKDWIDAATTGREALPIVVDAADVDPRNPDLAFGTGIYDYYAAVLPEKYPVLKPIMLFLPDGNKSRGLAELRHAAKRGRYANWEAMYFLMQVHYSIENKPSVALKYARKLLRHFPDNPVFHRYVGRTYVKLGNWKSAGKVFTGITRLVRKGKRGYSRKMDREAAYYLGYQAMLEKNYGKAISEFVRCDKLSRKLDTDEPSGFMIMANLRMGMTHDLMGQRKYARKQYDKVLSKPDYNGTHGMAGRYRKKAYR